MNDLTPTIEPKSDQLNADDLIPGPRTITVTNVSAVPSSAEQPVAISFEGDNGKPWKPCKSMRRVLVAVWGADGNAYIGRRLTLYRDPKVMWGGIEVGGIRISHMSDLKQPMTMALTVTRSNRKPFTVHPLKDEPAQAKKAGGLSVTGLLETIAVAPHKEALANFEKEMADPIAWLAANRPDQHQKIKDALQKRAEQVAAATDDPFGLPPIDDEAIPGTPDDTFPGDLPPAA